MKKLILTYFLSISTIWTIAQSPINRTDSTLNVISTNLADIKKSVVKKEPDPFKGQSLFEDREGKSAIFLPNGATFRLNTADASLKFAFINKVTNKDYFYGFDISGKTSDGLLPLIGNGDISPGTKSHLIFGKKEMFHDAVYTNKKGETFALDGWLTLNLGYEGSEFKLFNQKDTVFSNQIIKKSFNTFTSDLSFNFKIGGRKLLGLSVGYRKVNNYADLNSTEIKDVKQEFDTATKTTRTYETKTTVRIGEYKTEDDIPINFDFFWTPKNNQRLGYYHFWRGKFTNGKFTHGCGSGIYLLKNKNILGSIAGIVLEVSDISKLSDGFGKNFTLNFVVGYNFGFLKQ